MSVGLEDKAFRPTRKVLQLFLFIFTMPIEACKRSRQSPSLTQNLPLHLSDSCYQIIHPGLSKREKTFPDARSWPKQQAVRGNKGISIHISGEEQRCRRPL